MDDLFVITATCENVERDLQRITSLLTRNRLKIQEMYVALIEDNRSHLSITLLTNVEIMNKLIKQVTKMTDLLDVKMSLKMQLKLEV